MISHEFIKGFLIGLSGVCIGLLIRKLEVIYKKRALLKNLAKIEGSKGFKLKDGWAHNPLTKYPPNYVCFCGTGAKFKKCCSNTIPRYVMNSQVPAIESEMRDILNIVERNKGVFK